MKNSIEHAFFNCTVVRPLCKLIEGYMVRVLCGQFFFLDVSPVYIYMVPTLDRKKHCISGLTWRYESCEMDKATKGLPQKSNFSPELLTL